MANMANSKIETRVDKNAENPEAAERYACGAKAKRKSFLNKGTSIFAAAALASSLCIAPAAGAYAEDATAEIAAEETAPSFKGYDIVEKYITNSYIPTLSELNSIDFSALNEWDPKIGKELADLKVALQEEQDSGTQPGEGMDGGADTDPSDPSDSATPTDPVEGDGDSADPENSAGSQPEAITSDAEAEEALIATGTYGSAEQYPKWSYNGDTSFTMTHYTDNANAQKLLAVIGEQAREVAQKYGVSASEMIGLAMAKSFSGTNYMSQAPIRNLFGHTAYEAVEVAEYDEFGVAVKGSAHTEYVFSDEICEYATYKACLEDHAYRVANGIEESIPDDGTWGGPEGSLTNRVMTAIENYDLTRYDVALDYETTQPLTVEVWDGASESYVPVEVSLADLVAEVTSHLGVPYVWGGTTPAGFDCSGLVQYSFANALQMSIPRTTMYQCLQGSDVDFRDLHMGDMLFFTQDDVCCHVGMYLGEGCFIEAPHQGADVQVTMMDEKRPVFAKRLIPTQQVMDQEALLS